MFRQSAKELLRRQLGEWQKLIVDSLTNTQAINELVEVCRRRAWDTELQNIVSRIKTPGRASANPVQDQIRETFGEEYGDDAHIG